MKDATVPVGTSPEVLQHYLAAGIPIRTPEGIGKLVGLGSGLIHHPVEVQLDRRIACYKYGDCLPCLRPFSALTTPLEDGTVPAVEVAKLVMQANRPESRTPIASYGAPLLRETGESTISIDCHRATSYTLEVLIDSTWAVCTVYDFGIVYAHNMLAVYDYLRSKHFAVGLTESQYIAKSAPATPTKQEGSVG